MSQLLHHSLKKIVVCAAVVLLCSIPIYYFAISKLWAFEMAEHNILLTEEAGREDTLIIIGAVTGLSVVFFILLLGALILLNRWLSGKMWAPFYSTLQQVRCFDLDNPREIIFEPTAITEFDELHRTLKKLISGNLAAYTQQKQFADNASHELQTPLAIVQSKLELLSQSKPLSDGQYQLIEGAQAALSRAGHINKNLLLLTKIENCQFAEKERVDLTALLYNLLADFEVFIADKGFVTQVDIKDQVFVEGNKILIEILMGNLITNAVRHSDGAGTIEITLANNRMVIVNPGQASLRLDQLFKRFANVQQESMGTGLGLALVKQICSRYGWEVSYVFASSKHIFQVQYL